MNILLLLPFNYLLSRQTEDYSIYLNCTLVLLELHKSIKNCTFCEELHVKKIIVFCYCSTFCVNLFTNW